MPKRNGSRPAGDRPKERRTQERGGVISNDTMLGLRAEQEARAFAEGKRMEAQMLTSPDKITDKEVIRASEILRKYKAGKANLEKKIIANEEFWKLRQWRVMPDGTRDFHPASAWLWSCIQSRYSDAMDSYPTCNVQPRQQDDKPEAARLSAILPVILEQNHYEDTYSDCVWYALKQGGVCQGVFWDGSKHNGLGDISIKKVDFINLFWEPGITDIQKSANVFHTELVSNDIIEQRYPQAVGKLGGQSITLAKYLYDDHVDTSDKSVVIDWYYHTEYGGRRQLQYVKYVNDIVLYATENETQVPTETVTDQETGMPVMRPTGEALAQRGLYDHGLYPFVVMSLYPIEGSLCGYGLTDIGRDTQVQIDKLNKAIMDNAIVGATPRYFIRADGSVNEREFRDISNDLVHVAGQIGEENIRTIETKPLEGNYVTMLQQKIDELKYVTANQDANNGVAPSGITAASAIAALQEAAGKNSRSSNKTFYRAYREVVRQVIELIRQFYDLPRTFRIAPDVNQQGSEEQFVSYTNAALRPQPQQVGGVYTGLRLPEFDIEITAEKADPYKKMEINELALNFYQLGMFNPQMTDQAVAALSMMDFAKKDEVIKRISMNGTLQEMVLRYQQLALTLAQQYDPAMAEQLAQSILGQSGQAVPSGGGQPVDLEQTTKENSQVAKARAQARTSTQIE